MKELLLVPLRLLASPWVFFVILPVLVLSCSGCSEARAQGLVDGRRPFETEGRRPFESGMSTPSFSADRQLELRLKLEEARARASQWPSPLPVPALGSFDYQRGPCVWGYANCYTTYQIIQIGDRVFLQEGSDVTTRKEFKPW